MWGPYHSGILSSGYIFHSIINLDRALLFLMQTKTQTSPAQSSSWILNYLSRRCTALHSHYGSWIVGMVLVRVSHNMYFYILCRSFGRFTLVGTHTCPSIHKFLYHPITQDMREEVERKRAQSIIRSQQGKLQEEIAAVLKLLILQIHTLEILIISSLVMAALFPPLPGTGLRKHC